MCNAIANVQNLKSKVLSKPNSACALQSGHTNNVLLVQGGRYILDQGLISKIIHRKLKFILSPDKGVHQHFKKVHSIYITQKLYVWLLNMHAACWKAWNFDIFQIWRRSWYFDSLDKADSKYDKGFEKNSFFEKKLP